MPTSDLPSAAGPAAALFSLSGDGIGRRSRPNDRCDDRPPGRDDRIWACQGGTTLPHPRTEGGQPRARFAAGR
jgi:hypothetical protein